jgi:hypothetical protein
MRFIVGSRSNSVNYVKQFSSFCEDALAKRISTDGVSTLAFQFLPRREVNAYAFRRDQNAYVAGNSHEILGLNSHELFGLMTEGSRVF